MKNGPAILLLTLAWLGLTGSLTPANVVLGIAVSTVAAVFAREGRRRREVRLRPLRIVELAALFVYELALSGYRVARLALAPRLRLRPGIFAYPLRVDGDFEIALLANMITLTPGTLSVDISDDRRTLFVHAVDCSDVEQARRDIAQGFERKIMEAFR